MSWYVVILLVSTSVPGMLGTPYPQLVAVQMTKSYATEAECVTAGPVFLAARKGGMIPSLAANQKLVLGCVQW